MERHPRSPKYAQLQTPSATRTKKYGETDRPEQASIYAQPQRRTDHVPIPAEFNQHETYATIYDHRLKGHDASQPTEFERSQRYHTTPQASYTSPLHYYGIHSPMIDKPNRQTRHADVQDHQSTGQMSIRPSGFEQSQRYNTPPRRSHVSPLTNVYYGIYPPMSNEPSHQDVYANAADAPNTPKRPDSRQSAESQSSQLPSDHSNRLSPSSKTTENDGPTVAEKETNTESLCTEASDRNWLRYVHTTAVLLLIQALVVLWVVTIIVHNPNAPSDHRQIVLTPVKASFDHSEAFLRCSREIEVHTDQLSRVKNIAHENPYSLWNSGTDTANGVYDARDDYHN